jgi:hypothetical protein
MTSPTDHEDCSKQGPGKKVRHRSVAVKWRAAMALVGLVALAAGCGANGPAVAGSGTNTANRTSASTGSSSSAMAQMPAYARCMRSHGVSDFPDPTPSLGGGAGFQINGGPGSALNHNNPRFKAADQVCRSLLPGGEQAPTESAQKLGAEVKWAQCMRSHGLPGFPDPNAQGAFDSSKFDDSSPAFQTASKPCTALEPTGPVGAVPGHGPQ